MKMHGPSTPPQRVITALLSIFWSLLRAQTVDVCVFHPTLNEKCAFKLNLTSSFGLQVSYGSIKEISKQIDSEIKQHFSG